MRSNLPRKYKESIFRKIRCFLLRIFYENSEKENKITQKNNKRNFKEQLKQQYNKEKSKKEIVNIVDKHPELIETMSKERLKNLNQLYNEIIEKNNIKISELKKNREKRNNLTNIIKQKLKQKYNFTYIIKFEYDKNTYIQAFDNNNYKKAYFKVEGIECEKITDLNLLQKFKKLYEIEPSNVVYVKATKNIIDEFKALHTDEERKSFITRTNLQDIAKILISTNIDRYEKESLIKFFSTEEKINLINLIEKIAKKEYKKKNIITRIMNSKGWIQYAHIALAITLLASREDINDSIKLKYINLIDFKDFQTNLICSLNSDEKKLECINMPKYKIYQTLIISSLSSDEKKLEFLDIDNIDDKSLKRFGITEVYLLKEFYQKKQEYKEWVISFASDTLEKCELFTRVFGEGFARKRMSSLKDVELENERNEMYAGRCCLDSDIIILANIQNDEVSQFIKRAYRKYVILHECVHQVLKRNIGETGIQHIYNTGIEIGRGLNEGYTDWVCKKAGINCKSSECYQILEGFIEQIELAIGEENTMRLGQGKIDENYPILFGIDITDIYSLLMKADAVYKLGYSEIENGYGEAICEFESTLFDLYFSREFEEMKKKPIEEWDLSKYIKLAQLMSSNVTTKGEFSSIDFLNEINVMKKMPLIHRLCEINNKIEFSNKVEEERRAYILRDWIQQQEEEISRLREGELEIIDDNIRGDI